MPTLNSYWAKYGCDKCNHYKLLVLTANFWDSKSAFADWINQNNATHLCVCKDEGGADFKDALNNGNTGGPKYLIRPDKTFIRYPSASEINNAGGNVQHVCPTSITHEVKPKINSTVSFHKVTKNGFTINVLKDGAYSISFYSVKGQLKTMVSERFLSSGSHRISFGKEKLASGIYFVEMRDGKNITRQKIIYRINSI